MKEDSSMEWKWEEKVTCEEPAVDENWQCSSPAQLGLSILFKSNKLNKCIAIAYLQIRTEIITPIAEIEGWDCFIDYYYISAYKRMQQTSLSIEKCHIQASGKWASTQNHHKNHIKKHTKPFSL